ncbi:MAG: TetR/AcrR family transcriptional regulator [Anaerolineae bacterium]
MNQTPVNPYTMLEIAAQCFETQGYDQTTLNQIAEQADMPLELLERDFCCKAHLALHAYQHLSAQYHDADDDLPDGTIADRYYLMLGDQLGLLSAYPETISAVFAGAMRPQSTVSASDISPGMRDPLMQRIQHLVADASDTPSRDSEALALFLYAFHFLMTVFWLYDRSEDKQASQLFADFMREVIKLMRPMMVMPLVAKALNKVAMLMMVVFGGARLVDPTSSTAE